jgi:hypothetical protein
MVLVLPALHAAPSNGEVLTIRDLRENGEKYHQRSVSVTGQVAEVKTLSGPRDRPFYTFTLRDPNESLRTVTVIMQGKPEVSNGDHVFVHGVFLKSRKAGRSTITNRIEATIVEQLRDPSFIG